MGRKSPKDKSELPSLAWFARQANPFQDSATLLERLKLETCETKFLEWKSTPPIGANVSVRLKYRMVKAVISFANTDGGFVLFGLDSKGQWAGFTEADLRETDPAALAELINGCVSPELSGLNFAKLESAGRIYPVLHTPPSFLMPHVTTKEISERLPDGKTAIHLNKHAVYCRYLAKSDLATPAQFARIIGSRTDYLKTELLRRVKEIEVPSFKPGTKSASASPTILRVSMGSKDNSLPAVRITRDASEATGLIVHEELSNALFDEINNVLDANNLLARNRPEFVFGFEIYYRIYAERQHIEQSPEKISLLARAGVKFYAPTCFWVLRMTPNDIALLIKEILTNEKATQNRLACRMAILLGPKVAQWMKKFLDKRWFNHAQPPEHYFAFKKMIAKGFDTDSRLVALQTSNNSEVELPSENNSVKFSSLLVSSRQTGVFLSKACMAVFGGDINQRSLCRTLDIATYGSEFRKMEEDVYSALQKLE
ncbi:MAG TPA: hypothetical protein DCQ92_04595 [Verrucomicrobia subdivision 3 bacterium]|nr:hypothetical protein [Limisphaerales bacterium]